MALSISYQIIVEKHHSQLHCISDGETKTDKFESILN